MIGMINSLLEDDGLMIENGNLRQINNPSKKIKAARKTVHKKIPIKTIRLDKSDYILFINQEKTKSFRPNSKQFKMLAYLWDFHWRMKDGKVIQEGDFVPTESLKKHCDFPTMGALRKQKTRLNKLFSEKGIAAKLDNANNNYRLIIHMT